MKFHVAGLSMLLVLLSVATLVAETATPQLTTVGKVVSLGNTSMVVKIDDHGHPIPFVIGTSTVMTTGIEVGSRVKVVYHPIGSTGQIADSVIVIGSCRV
jgi:hypothetical protein